MSATDVALLGADLKEYPLHDEPMARLEAGTVVWELRRLGEHVRVRTPDGLGVPEYPLYRVFCFVFFQYLSCSFNHPLCSS